MAQQPAQAEVLTLLAEAVTGPELRESPHLPLQQQLLALINAILPYAGDACLSSNTGVQCPGNIVH